MTANSVVDPGSLKHRITIQARTQVQDALGQQTDAFTDVVTCWAAIKAASSREVYATSGFVEQLSHVITIRHNRNAVPTSGMVVLDRSRVFDIQAVSDPDESRNMLSVYCLERH